MKVLSSKRNMAFLLTRHKMQRTHLASFSNLRHIIARLWKPMLLFVYYYMLAMTRFPIQHGNVILLVMEYDCRRAQVTIYISCDQVPLIFFMHF